MALLGLPGLPRCRKPDRSWLRDSCCIRWVTANTSGCEDDGACYRAWNMQANSISKTRSHDREVSHMRTVGALRGDLQGFRGGDRRQDSYELTLHGA